MNLKLCALRVAIVLPLYLAAGFYECAISAKIPPKAQGNTRGITLADDAKAKVASELSGHYYALVIGINNYQHIPKLSTAAPDAKALATLLHDRYGFQTTVLLDATRDQITKAMNDFRSSLDENASLLIYYAGHGYYDKDADKAYWLPVDADPDDNSHWIMADDITTEVKVIPARHVLIISDSCYSGGMTREIAPSFTAQERDRFLEKMALGKSRTLMSSGALEPVSDIGGGGHSAFTGALIQALTASSDNVFSAGGVFDQYIQVSVAGRSEQTPQYVPIRNSGHDFGDFAFVRSGAAPPPTPAPQSPGDQPTISQGSPPRQSRQLTTPARVAQNSGRALLQSLTGDHDFGNLVATIALSADGLLTSSVPGMAPFILEPAGDLIFNTKGVPGYSTEFLRDANGAVNEAISHQPIGSFNGQRRSGEAPSRALLNSLVGNYDVGPFIVSVAMSPDGALTWFVPGQPLYELRFTHALRFVAAGVPGFSVDFNRDGNGNVTGATIHQGNVDFLARRK